VQLVLNDKGRVEVGSQLGSGVDKIEGTLIGQDADTYTLSVAYVYQINGNSTKWAGEQVKVAMMERRATTSIASIKRERLFS